MAGDRIGANGCRIRSKVGVVGGLVVGEQPSRHRERAHGEGAPKRKPQSPSNRGSRRPDPLCWNAGGATDTGRLVSEFPGPSDRSGRRCRIGKVPGRTHPMAAQHLPTKHAIRNRHGFRNSQTPSAARSRSGDLEAASRHVTRIETIDRLLDQCRIPGGRFPGDRPCTPSGAVGVASP